MATAQEGAEPAVQQNEKLTEMNFGKSVSSTESNSKDTSSTRPAHLNSVASSESAVTSKNLKDNYVVVTCPESDTETSTKTITTSVTSVFATSVCANLIQDTTAKNKDVLATCSTESSFPNITSPLCVSGSSISSAQELSAETVSVASESEKAESASFKALANPQRVLQPNRNSASAKTTVGATESSLQQLERGFHALDVSESSVCESQFYAILSQESPAKDESAGSTDCAASTNHQRVFQTNASTPSCSAVHPAVNPQFRLGKRIISDQQMVAELRNNSDIARPARPIHPVERELGIHAIDADGAVDLRAARRAHLWNTRCLSCREEPKEVRVLPCGHWILCGRCFLDPNLGVLRRCCLCNGEKESVELTKSFKIFLLNRS